MRIRKSFKRRLIFVLVFLIGFGCHGAYRLTQEAIGTSDRGHLLIASAEHGDVPAVKHLLQTGVDPNFNSRGRTALKAARINGHQDVVKLLTAAGAKYEIQKSE